MSVSSSLPPNSSLGHPVVPTLQCPHPTLFHHVLKAPAVDFPNSIYTIALYPYLKMHICMYAGWRCGCRSPQVQQCPQLSVRCPSATVFSLKSSSAISSLDQLHQRHGIHIKLSPVEQPPSALSTSQLLCYSLASCTSAIVSTSTPPARPTSCASGTCYLSPSSHRQLSPS
jgi:hypothetical protein